MSDKSDVLSRLDDARSRFRAKVAGLPPEAFDEPWLGTWNLSQLLAHMAGWYREMAGAFDRVRLGERPTLPGVDYSDPEPWNARFVTLSKPGTASVADWDAAYAAYHDAASRLPEALFGFDPEKGRPRIGDRLLQEAGIGHFQEHEPQLTAWIESRR